MKRLFDAIGKFMLRVSHSEANSTTVNNFFIRADSGGNVTINQIPTDKKLELPTKTST